MFSALGEEGHCVLPAFLTKERRVDILAEVVAAPLSQWKAIFNDERPNATGDYRPFTFCSMCDSMLPS